MGTFLVGSQGDVEENRRSVLVKFADATQIGEVGSNDGNRLIAKSTMQCMGLEPCVFKCS